MRRPTPVLALAAAVLLHACSGQDPIQVPPPPPPPPAVATVTVSGLPATMFAGDPAPLTAVLKDAQGNTLTGRAVVWSTSDANVADVNQSGLVNGVGHGPVTITATSETKIGIAVTDVTLTLPVWRFAMARVSATGTLTASRNATTVAGGVAAAHTGPGDYTVTLTRMAHIDPAWRETVMLSKGIDDPAAAPGATGAGYCHLNSYGNAANLNDLTVSVSCYNAAGQKKDGAFEVLVFGNGVIEGRSAFLESTDAAQSHTPDPSKLFNSSGQPMTVIHQGPGNYMVVVGNPRTTVAENYFVTTRGGPDATCWIDGWNEGADATFLCDSATSSAVDALFLMQMIGGGRTGQHWAFALADNPFPGAGGTYTPVLVYQGTSGFLPITITGNPDPAMPVGSYLVKFPLFASLPAGYAVQVSAYLSPGKTCAAAPSGTAGTTLIVQVNCYNRYTGAAAGAYFVITILE